ncbi:hypothetical protein LCGC14_1942360, partial [marine sediment metagenome]
RILASRVQAPLQLLSSSSMVRKLAARDLAAFVGTGIGILSMAKLAGADVEMDPRSSNFAKIRVGPTRLDFWAGFQPIARYVAQAATGERKSALGNIGEVSLIETGTRFLQSKLSPQAGAAVDIVHGETEILLVQLLRHVFDVPAVLRSAFAHVVSNLSKRSAVRRTLRLRLMWHWMCLRPNMVFTTLRVHGQILRPHQPHLFVMVIPLLVERSSRHNRE